VADDVLTLFDDFAVRRARGERPDVREYLERAGERADELVPLLDRLLASTPPAGEADPAVVAAFEARLAGEPPLLALRARRGVTRDQVVDRLVGRLQLDRRKTEKVRRYYHELETGLLEPRGVTERVFAALGEVLRTDVEALATWRPSPSTAEATAFYRVGGEPGLAQAPAAAPEPHEEEWDEVDELFRGHH
jgi:hypothetical protein